jgi:4-amino-4-deoxy-L-arabinose transferase-like glycosyltransferase
VLVATYTGYAGPRAAFASRRDRIWLLAAGRWPIIAVLTLQAAVSLITLRNSAFQDEALYLYAGRQIIHHWHGGPAPLLDYSYFLSGYPYVYPVIGGFLDMAGGLELARAFSLACMLGVTALGYSMTDKLFGRCAAVFAAAAYASADVVLFLGRLATYDPLCLFFIALAAAMAVRGGMGRRPWGVLAVGPAIVLAILAKYAALLFVLPVLAVLVCVSISYVGLRRAIPRLLLAAASLAFSLVIAYEVMDKGAFHAISGSTTNRQVGFKAPRTGLLTHVLQMGGAVYLIAFVGLLLAVRLGWRFRVIAVVLFGSSWLVPAYHVYMREPISLDKHIAYALFFAMPLAGYALAWISGYERPLLPGPYRGQWLAGLAAVLVVFALGLGQSRHLYSGWANTSGLSTALHTQLRDGSGRILAEDIEVSEFDALDVTEPWQWQSFYYPYYVNHHGQHVFGSTAISQGIQDRYYNWVELSFIYLPDQAYYAAGQMALTRNYDLIAVILFSNSYGKGHYYLFRSALVPGHGNFVSLAQLKNVSWGG